MKEIVERLHENRQVELAKSILESAGYRVIKENEEVINEVSADDIPRRGKVDNSMLIDLLEELGNPEWISWFKNNVMSDPEEYGMEPEFVESIVKFLGTTDIIVVTSENIYDYSYEYRNAYDKLFKSMSTLLQGGRAKRVKEGDNDFPEATGFMNFYKITSPLGNVLKASEYGNNILWIPDTVREKLIDNLSE